MTVHPLHVPRLGVNDDAVTVVRWLVADGDAVRPGQVVCEVETTKATTEVEAEHAGRLMVLVEAGEEVTIDRPLALIGEDAEALRRERQRRRQERPTEAAAGTPLHATAKAVRLAQELGVDLAAVAAGVAGVIREKDVAAFAAAGDEPDVPACFAGGQGLPVAIYGAGRGGVAALEAMMAEGGFAPVCFLDDSSRRPRELEGLPVFGGDRLEAVAAAGARGVFVAIAAAPARLRVQARCEAAGLAPVTIVHPRAFVAPSASLGPGSIVKAGAIVDTASHIGRACIIDNGAVIAHDSRIADGCHLAPGAVLGSSIAIGAGTVVGIGAAIATGVTIGQGCIIAPGAAVTRDAPDHAVVEGVPGRVIGSRRGTR